MGVRRVSKDLKKARGTMSQKEAAHAWGVAESTLGAIEQGVVRDYRPHTVAPLDAVLGRSVYDMLNEPDEPGTDIPAASHAELEQLRDEVQSLLAIVDQLVERQQDVPGELDMLLRRLDDDELGDVLAYGHFVLARRNRRATPA